MEHEPLPGEADRDDREHPGEREGRGTSGNLHAGERPLSSGTVLSVDDLRITDMTDRKDLYMEEIIIYSLKSLLIGRVNQLLAETEHPIPPIEFGHSLSVSHALTPVLWLSTCEQTEKERVIRLDAYPLTITLTVPEHPDGEQNCYAYAGTVATVLRENPTLGGVVDRAVLTGKRYTPPKQNGTGGDWTVILTLRIVLEETDI
jgi:hypothetical protein